MCIEFSVHIEICGTMFQELIQYFFNCEYFQHLVCGHTKIDLMIKDE